MYFRKGAPINEKLISAIERVISATEKQSWPPKKK